MGTIITLIRINEDPSKHVAKQIQGRGGFTSLETGTAPLPALSDTTAMLHLQLHNKTSLCPLPKLSMHNYQLIALYCIAGSPDKAQEAVSPRVTLKSRS